MTDRHHRYESFGAIPRGMLEETARTYAAVFSAPPWNERWEHDRVVQKIAREIDRENAFLSLILDPDGETVGGFCWGAVVRTSEIPERVEAAHPVDDAEALQRIQPAIGAERVMFVDELALLLHVRGGITPIMRLSLPFLDIVAREDVGILCWSVAESRIVPILLDYFGFVEVGAAGPLRFFHLPAAAGRRWREVMIRHLEGADA